MTLRCLLFLLLTCGALSVARAQVQDYDAFPLPDDPPYMTLYVSLITFLFTYEAPNFTSEGSASSREDKLIHAAGEDAASFVASQGPSVARDWKRLYVCCASARTAATTATCSWPKRSCCTPTR